MTDDVTITVRVNDQTAAGFRDVNGHLRDMNGRFAATAGSVNQSSSVMSRAMVGLRAGLLSLAPAAVPVAASLAPIVVQAGAAGLAVAAFGAAVVPQIANLKDAAGAQTKYSDAVAQYGAHSKQAVAAQQQAAQVMAGIPKATQAAAAAYSNLKATFTTFSDSTAKFTMAPVEKSFAVLGQVIPRLTPMVESTATQLDRLMTVAGGGVSSSAFDGLAKKVSDFANQTLKSATDKAIHFVRVLSEGNATGPIASFMDYARANGPATKELLTNLAEAVTNLLEGASQAGPGLLTLVSAFAKLVASVPPSLIANLMQVYAAFKLIKLAGAGVGAVAGGFASLATRVAALRAASVAAGGGIAGMNAALNTLSTGGKAALALGIVGGLSLAMHKLSDNKGPVAVDELSTALNTLSTKGKVTGALKENFDDIASSIAMVSKGASDNKIAGMVSDFGTWIGISTGPGISTAKKNIDAWDKSMANLVKGGHSKEAAAQYEILKKAWLAGGGDVDRLKDFTNDYNNALADQKFEAKMAAESMGLFGAQALKTQSALDAQKSSADGLRQSITALNDANRAGLGGMIGFEAAIDAASKAAQENAGALSMNHGVLDLSSEKARTAASALQDLASKTDEAAGAARESGSSWETVNGVYERGRDALIKSAQAMGLSATQAAALADQILKIPNKTAKVNMNVEDAKADLGAFNAAVKRSPGSKSVTLKTLSKAGEQVLEGFGLKVKRLPNGKVTVTAKTGTALSGVRDVAAAVASLKSKSITVTTHLRSDGASFMGASGRYASGGRVRGYASGGDVQAFPDGGYVQGPGTSSSDSVMALFGSGARARVSDTEYVIRSAAVRKYGVRLFDALNSGRVKVPGLASGGVTKAEAAARKAAVGDLTVSRFGTAAGYQRSEMRSGLASPDSLSSLVSSLNQWRSIIQKATHGAAESRLLKTLDSTGKKLLGYEKSLTKVTASLDKAKTKLDDLKSAASQLSDSVKSGVLSSANITKNATGGPITTASVMAGLTASRDKATSFSAALAGLQKKGLSASLLQQIGEAGIDGGGLETAGALMNASSSEIKSLNGLQSQITTAAGAAGATTSNAVYGAQIKAQQASVTILTKSQASLTKSMDKLAAAMEKSIEKAFGKKASGGIIGAASGGLRSGWTMVGEQEPELVRLPFGSRVYSGPDTRRMQQQAWSSMLNVPRGTAARTAAASARPQPAELVIRSGGSRLDDLLVELIRKAVSNSGGNVQRALGQGVG